MAPIKRKHKTLSLQEKYIILQKLKTGVSGKKLAEEYGVGCSTITDIKKQRQRIESFLGKNFGYSANRKTLKNAGYPKMEENLYSWIISQNTIHAPLTHDIVAKKAKQLYEKYYGNDQFRASKGWIRNFKHRCGLKMLDKEWDIEENQPRGNSLKEHENVEEISAMLNRIGSAVTEIGINQWIDVDQEIVPNEDEEKEVEVKEEEEIEAGSSVLSENIRHDDAVGYFNICLEWANQNDVELNDIIVLQRLKEKALLLSQSNIKQAKDTDFF